MPYAISTDISHADQILYADCLLPKCSVPN